jgi:DNA-binding MarR family transcriptional regulator
MATMTRSRHEAVLQASRHLSEVLKAMHDYSRRMELRYEVSGPQLWLLWHLRTSPVLAIRELAERMFLHPSSVTRLADGLERKGLVARSRDGADRRVVYLCLTDEGRRRLRNAPMPVRQRLLGVLEGMPEELLVPLAEGLSVLAGAATTAADEGADGGSYVEREDG